MAILAELSKAVKDALKQGPPPAEPKESRYDDHAYIKTLVVKIRDQTSYQRWTFERQWFRSILYYAGNQWISFDRSNRRWREKKLRKWVPKPVTNRFASTVDAVTAALQAARTEVSIWPATTDADDIATASVADRVLEVIDDEVGVDKLKPKLAKWCVLTGNAYLLLSYDLGEEHGTELVQYDRCPIDAAMFSPTESENGVCPEHEGAVLTPAVDEFGRPSGRYVPRGRLMGEVLSSFDVFVNMEIDNLEEQTAILVIKSYDLDTVKRTWPETGASVKGDTIEFAKTGQHLRESLAYVTDETAYTSGRGIDNLERATIARLFLKPTEEFPEGLYVAMSGTDVLLESGPLPYFERRADDAKQYFFPMIKYGFSYVPGRFFHKTPAVDLLPKQDQRNRIESLIELIYMRGAYGTWLKPAGSGITNLTGEPGQTVTWTPAGTGGAEPKFIQGQGIPPTLLSWLDKIDSDFEELAGTFDILKGSVPRGVSAGYAIQLLTERGYSRFAPAFSHWEASWRDYHEIALKIFKEYATEERIKVLKGKSGQWEVQKFSRSDISGAINIRIESGQTRPKSQLAIQAAIEELLKAQILDATDPEQKWKIAQEFGMGWMLGGVDDDMREAAREYDEFTRNIEPTMRQVVDNHLAHIVQHQRSAKQDSYRELPPEQQQLWEQHIQEHMTASAPPPEQPPPGGGGGSPPAMSKAREKGDKTMDILREGGSAMGGT